MKFFAFVQKHCGPFLVPGFGYLTAAILLRQRRGRRRSRRTAPRSQPQVSGSARRRDARACSSEKLVISLPYRRRSLCSAADRVWKNS